MADDGQYQDQDTVMGGLLSRLLNPPPDPDRQIAQNVAPPSPAQAPRSPVPTIPANDPRFAVQAGEPPNPVLKVRPQVAPSPAVAPKPATPPAVTPSGNGPAAPKSWADYVRQSNDSSLQSLSQAQQYATDLQNEPSATAENAPLEAQRTALAQPLNPNDPNYRPGIATRIARGFYGARKGGPGGILDPSAVGATPYGAPNSRFTADTARRQAQAGVLQSEEERNIANEKADSEKMRNQGTDERAIATGYQDVAKSATAQQNADSLDATRKDNSPEGVAALDQAQFDQRTKQADQLKLKGTNRTLYLVNGKLPDPRQATEGEIARSQATAAWQRANPGKTPTLDDIAAINAAAGGYGGPRGTANNLTKNQQDAIVRQKNAAIQKAQATLDAAGDNPDADTVKTARDAMQAAQDNYEEVLGITPDSPEHMTVGDDLKWMRAGGQQPAQTAPAQPQAAPKSAAETQVGQAYKGYKYLGGDRTDPKNWQKVGQ